jgi:poly(3-hydroxybutyrate) depolymerase
MSTHALAKSQYELYVPSSYDASTPMPVVIALHGTTQDGPYYMNDCGVRNAADSRGFIAAAPTGWGTGNQFRYKCCDANCLDICQEDGEEDFMLAMLDEIEACYNVDVSRIYMFGFSQGGFFSSWFCLRHETSMTACGAHGAGCYSGGNGGHCDLISMSDQSRKVPFYVFAGTGDEYHDGATDFASLLSKHGYQHTFVEPPGQGHWCDPAAVAAQWDWWATVGAL